MNTYTISEIKSYSEQTYGNYQQHRTVFKVQGNDNWLSAFVANPLVPGSQITGEITTKEKDGKTFYNFNFPRSGSTVSNNPAVQNPDRFTVGAAEIKNYLDLKIMPTLQKIQASQDRIQFLLDNLDPKNPSRAIDRAFDEAYPDETAFN